MNTASGPDEVLLHAPRTEELTKIQEEANEAGAMQEQPTQVAASPIEQTRTSVTETARAVTVAASIATKKSLPAVIAPGLPMTEMTLVRKRLRRTIPDISPKVSSAVALLGLTENELDIVEELAEGKILRLSHIVRRLAKGDSLDAVEKFYQVRIVVEEAHYNLDVYALLKLEERFADIDLSGDPTGVLEHVQELYLESGYSGPFHSFVDRILRVFEFNPETCFFGTAVDLFFIQRATSLQPAILRANNGRRMASTTNEKPSGNSWDYAGARDGHA